MQAKVDDLLYQIRFTRVTTDPAPAYALVRQLVAIGKPAVPSIIAELDRTTADLPMRALVFTLRAIADPRAIPALIRAIPRTAVAVSDFGDNIDDRDLWTFINDHRAQKNTPEPYPQIEVRRANVEIMFALEQMTHYSVGRASVGGAGGNGLAAIERARELRQMDADLWQDWWNDNASSLLAPEDLAFANAPPAPGDPLRAAHEAVFGQLFPTGPAVRLSSPVELFIEDVAFTQKNRGKAYVNLKTGQRYASPLLHADETQALSKWIADNSIDVSSLPGFNIHTPVSEIMSGDFSHATHQLTAHHLQLWSIPNPRWDTLEAEIQKPGPLDVGQSDMLDEFIARDPESGEISKRQFPATFLFITADHAHGILQIMNQSKAPSGLRFRYRLWTADATHLPGPTTSPN